MNEEQIKEVMRLGELWAAYAWKACSHGADETVQSQAGRAALEAYLRTIGEPAGYSLPAGSIGAKKFAQVGGGFTPVGLVFSRGESAMAITEHGRVYWDRDLVHPISGEPESVNAELLDALKGMVDAHAIPSSYCKERSVYDQARAAIARAESAIETPAKVSPCAGHAVQQEADEVIGLAQALEQHRARKIVDAVSALPVGGKHEESPSPFHAGYQLACDEVMHRLLTEEWDGCLTPPGKQEDDEAGGA